MKVCLEVALVLSFVLLGVVSINRAQRNPDELLVKFGYLRVPHGTEAGSVQHSPQDRSTALSEFQRFVGLPVTGELDRRTLNKLRQPRCGFPDIIEPLRPTRRRGRPGSQRSPHPIASAFYVPGNKWNKHRLTWRMISFSASSSIPHGQQRLSMHRAFQKWSNVSPLSFQEGGGSADIKIKFVRSAHGDGYQNAFDGRGSTLAHAFFPGSGDLSGATHFDDDEEWTLNSNRGTNLEIVAAHEFGHALGLGHSNVQAALMAPYYKGYEADYALHSDDIQAIQYLYGPKRTPTRHGPSTTTRRPGTGRPRTGRNCTLKFDDVIQAHDGHTYVLRGSKIYKLIHHGGIARGFPKPIRRVYRRAPINVNAAAYSAWTRKTYMFKGTRVWRYTQFRLDAGYPKALGANLPSSPGAALVWRDGRIYLFKGSRFWGYDDQSEAGIRGYPLSIMNYWRNVPNNPEATVRWRDGYTYIFKGVNYFKFDDYGRRVKDGYPKSKAASWLGCGLYTPK